MKNQIAHKTLNSAYTDIITIIGSLGYDTNNENFLGTPDRCSRALLNDFVIEKSRIDKECKKLFKKVFPAEYDEMVIQRNIPVVSLCPHHLLPIEMKVYIGYIPKKKVIGLSKLARLAKLLGKQPILQEQYTKDVASWIDHYLDPLGVGIYVLGNHGCMRFRGVNVPDTDTVTSHLIGNFKQQQATREEFLRLCRQL